jgi:hypothetical protein
MNDKHWRASDDHGARPTTARTPDFMWERLMALKAAAIILSVVAAILIFHG